MKNKIMIKNGDFVETKTRLKKKNEKTSFSQAARFGFMGTFGKLRKVLWFIPILMLFSQYLVASTFAATTLNCSTVLANFPSPINTPVAIATVLFFMVVGMAGITMFTMFQVQSKKAQQNGAIGDVNLSDHINILIIGVVIGAILAMLFFGFATYISC